MLNISRDSFDFEFGTNPGEIILLPDGGAIREALLKMLPPGEGRLGRWTFTPRTLLSDFERQLDLPEEISPAKLLFLVKEILLGDDDFAALAMTARGVTRVKDLLLALRRAGISSGEGLLSSLDSSGARIVARHELLARILDEYTQRLGTAGLTDRPGRENFTIEAIREGGLPQISEMPAKAHAVWFRHIRRTDARIIAVLSKFIDVNFYEPADVSPFPDEKMRNALLASGALVARFARELGADVREDSPRETVDCPANDIIRAIASRDGRIVDMPASDVADWPRVSAFEARSALDEADMLASAAKSLCMDYGLCPNEIAIYSDSPTDVRRALQEHGLPFSGGSDASLASELPAQLLALVRSAIGRKFTRRELFALLSHPFMGRSDVSELDTVFCELGCRSALDVSAERFGLIVAEMRPAAERLDDICSRILRTLDLALGNKVLSGKDYVKIVKVFFDEFGIKTNAIRWILEQPDIESASALKNSLDNLLETLELFADSPPDGFSEHCDLLFELLSDSAPEERAELGVRVLPLADAYRCTAKVAIVPNCVQGKVPRADGELLFLSPGEASALELAPPDALFAVFCDILSLISKAELTVLSRPLAEGDRELPPSPLFVSLFRALGDGANDYRDRMAEITKGLTARPFTRRRIQVSAGTALTKPASEFAQHISKFVGAGDIAETARIVDVFRNQKLRESSKFSGFVGGAFAEPLEKISKHISVSSLDSLNKCRFAFFLEKILGVEELPKPTDSIDAMAEGIAFHKALEVFWGKRIEEFFGKTPIEQRIEMVKTDFANAQDRIAVHESNIDSAMKQIPECISAAMEKIDLPENALEKVVLAVKIHSSLENYIRAVSEIDDGFVPITTEMTINREIDETTIKARIDRLDADERGRLRVIDYKRNGAPNSNDVLAKKALQLPLYCIVAEKFGEIFGAQYWIDFAKKFPAIGGVFERKDGVPVEEWHGALGDFKEHVMCILGELARGEFRIEPVSGTCPSYCPFGHICGFDPDQLEGEAQNE
ncbi:MAG TPA: PD-(D/E)XK nuclease family protein [candidate division Zixibacteria bacterium]|nr:PD-(D/E)XK nuclease family protein [candidate division Zixibacteria bacterium]